MRLISYRSDRGDRAAALRGDEVIDAGDALGGGPATARELLAADALGELAARLDGAGALGRLADVELLPPIPDPEKIVCIGLNYSAHAAEAGIEPPGVPTFFAKFRNALAADGATVELPAATSPATPCSTTSPPATSSSRRRSGSRARSSTAPRPAVRRS